MPKPKPLATRIALVTGAASGIGKAIAVRLAAEGACVVIADLDEGKAQSAAEEIARAGGAIGQSSDVAVGIAADVTNEEAVQAAIDATLLAFGGIDIVINNAGQAAMKYNQPFGALSRNEIRSLFDVNVMGVINVTLACRDSMAERGGGVVLNISSMAGYMSATPYAVSKLTVRGLTVAFATELAPDRIRVNAIAPGLMNTENALADLPKPLIDDFVQRLQLVHRLGRMDDVVQAAVFLASDEASFITGETLKVSGGYPLNF